MRLSISFEADQRPEAQHQLRQIPSADRVDHPDLKAALERYQAARKAEHEARLTHVQLEQELPAAEYRDEVALADAREKGAKDPGARNANAHRKQIQEAKRDWGACKIALARAVEGVSQAFADHGDAWEAELVQQREDLRSAMAELLQGWQRLWGQLQGVQSNLALGSGMPLDPRVFAAHFRAPMVRDGNVVQVADVLAGLRDLAKPEPESSGAVENKPIGHVPPSQQPFAGLGSQQVPFGAQRDPETVREWRDRDEADARQRGAALADERRQERVERAPSRRAERESRREAEGEAIEAVR